MILAQYRNPPYRSPTPRTNSNGSLGSSSSRSPPPPAAQQQAALERRSQSPKRKREESFSESAPPMTEATALKPTMLNVAAVATTHGIGLEEAVESGANSPRTKVAEKFKGLEVTDGDGRGGAGVVPSSSQSPRKKLKLVRDGDAGGSTPLPSYSHELEIPDSEGPSLLEMTKVEDVRMESPSPTPISSPQVVVPPHRRTLSKVPSLRKESSYLSTRQEPTPSPPSLQKGELPPTSSPPTGQPTQPSKRRLSSPPPSLESMTLTSIPLTSDTDQSQSHLTWQLSEITGHDIDASNPDDDGEGINGIGFKPTPAMAHARSLKRKKQVEEWKSREAREARQRRFERRKRGGGGLEGGGDAGVGGKRTVRFVDA